MLLACVFVITWGVQPSIEERLDRFDALTSEIEDLTATFEQRKHSVLLRKPLVSRGTVSVRGEVVRWDTKEPVSSVIRVDATDARMYYPDQNLLEIYDFGADLRFLAGSPVPQLDALKERFELRETDAAGLEGVDDDLVISLTPFDERIAERIERVRLALDEEAGVMRQIEILDPDGERTVIVFKKMRINQGLGEADVALETPDDVRVSRPFGEREVQGGE